MFKKSYLLLALGLTVPAVDYAASLCIAVDGGFGHGGSTFVAPTFVEPAVNGCSPFSGFVRTATTVIALTSGSGCLTTSGKELQFTLSSASPNFFGVGTEVHDYVTVCPASVTQCPITQSDAGQFSGTADVIACTAALLKYPQGHD